MTTRNKKLIEVALPLPEINDASAYDKMPGIGPHPKGIHQWWARLPLPTARAILFASVVDDPSSHPERWPTEDAQNSERERLFGVIRRMMTKKLHCHPEVYAEARAEMLSACEGEPPTIFDPFAGGGTIPLEAGRLGFEAQAADLNPIAVLLNKCNLEIAPRWTGRPPINPESQSQIGSSAAWRGTFGLAADVRYYGRLIYERARQKIGKNYPLVRLPKDLGGGEANVVAWIWARTVATPDPSKQGKHVPLITTYWLSSKKTREVWLEPFVDSTSDTYRFEVRTGPPPDPATIANGTKRGRGTNFQCLLSDNPIGEKYIRAEGHANRLGFRLLATVASLGRGRIYLPATAEHEAAARLLSPEVESPDMPDNARWFSPPLVGLGTYTSIFSPRQLSSLATFSELIKDIAVDVRRDATKTELAAEAEDYASSVTTFLALALDRCADFNNAICRWSASNEKVMNLFGRQAIPMVWDFAEANIMGSSVGAWNTCYEYVADCVQVITSGNRVNGAARQLDAASGAAGLSNLLVSTDPPYYDNMGYGALSDFFYVWLRRSIRNLYPDLFSTVRVPTDPELTASPDRFGGDETLAKEHFERGFKKAFTALRDKLDPRFPLTVYYAFKQEDEEQQGIDEQRDKLVDLTTGWETLLEALIGSGFQITATWPVRASQKWRMVSMGTNALASYIVLACRLRSPKAPQIDRRSFVAELKRDLPTALRHLQQGNVAPVDFAQASIGPGMAIYSQYSSVVDSSGASMSIRAALSLINQTLSEVLSEQEDDFDSETRWAISWFDQHGFEAGDYGEAELLSKAKVTSISGLQHSQIVNSKGGRVSLRRPSDLPSDWEPLEENRIPIWEATHHLLRIYYYEKAGDSSTAELLKKLGPKGDLARELAYRLHNIAEKNKRSLDAQAYNALVLGWPEFARLAGETATSRVEQSMMFVEE